MRLALAVLFVFFGVQSVWAQSDSEFLACRSIENDIARLECYDRVRAPTENGAVGADSECTEMPFQDLLLDIKILTGQCVSTVGSVMNMGQMVTLSQDMMGLSGIFLDTEGLSREERKLLLGCQPCRLKVVGVVSKVVLTDGLRAISVERPQ